MGVWLRTSIRKRKKAAWTAGLSHKSSYRKSVGRIVSRENDQKQNSLCDDTTVWVICSTVGINGSRGLRFRLGGIRRDASGEERSEKIHRRRLVCDAWLRYCDSIKMFEDQALLLYIEFLTRGRVRTTLSCHLAWANGQRHGQAGQSYTMARASQVSKKTISQPGTSSTVLGFLGLQLGTCRVVTKTTLRARLGVRAPRFRSKRMVRKELQVVWYKQA